MRGKMYEMCPQGGLQEVDTEKYAHLEPGTVLRWGGNMAWGPEEFVIIERKTTDWGTNYKTVSLKDKRYHHTEAHGIKEANDPKVWHSQHMFLQKKKIVGEELKRLTIEAAQKERKFQEAQQKAEVERQIKIEKGKKLFKKYIPSDAKALIVAEHDVDKSDVQTDYFAHTSDQMVVLGWSKHTRDLFSEMRKHAVKLPETEHLGPKNGHFEPRVVIKESFSANGRYYSVGQYSHWHREITEDKNGHQIVFRSREEAENYIMDNLPESITFDGKLVHFGWEITEEDIEHREKYSMGNGYYLKDGFTNSTGWKVRKTIIRDGDQEWLNNEIYVSLAERCIL